MKCEPCGAEPETPAEEREYERVRGPFGDAFVCAGCAHMYEHDDRFTFPDRPGGEATSRGEWA